MSVHYLIDGYNVIKQTPFLASKKLEDAREEFIRLIRKDNLTGSQRNEVTVIFDGRDDVFAPSPRREVKIIFSAGESADDRIKKIISSSGNPARIILVSNDKELISFAGSYRAGICSVNAFLRKPSKNKNTVKISDKAELGFTTARRITEELKGIWLKNKKVQAS